MSSKGIFSNVAGSLIMQVVNIMSNLILPPLLIAAYGSQCNGLTSTISQLISYISLVGAGISVSTTQALYKPLAENDNKTVSGMMNATGNMFNKMGMIFVFIAFAVSFIYPLFIHTSMDYFMVVLLMMVMSISGAMEFFSTGRYRSLLQADRKIYVYTLIQSFCLLFSTLLAVLAIYLKLNIIWTQAMISFVYILRAFCLHFYVSRRYKYLDKRTRPINRVISKRKDAMYHQLIGLIVTGSQSIILSIFVGLEAASIYAIYNVVFSGLQSICVQISNSVVPYIGRLYVMKNKNNLKLKYSSFELVFFMFITIIFATTFVMIKSFITLYTKGADINYVNYYLIILFVIRGFASCFRLPSQGLISASGFFAETKRAATIEAAICIFFELALVNYCGIYGIMFGNIAALIWRGFEMILFTNRQIIVRNSALSILRVIKCTFIICVIYFVSNIILPLTMITSFSTWIIFAVIVTFFSIIVTLLIYLLTEKGNIKSAIKLLI